MHDFIDTMSKKLLITLLASAFVLIPSFRALAADGKLEPLGAYADPGASEGLKKTLEEKGWRVSVAGAGYCDIWLRASVPGGKTDAAGAVYTWIGDSALIGVITFANQTTDFRGQSLKAGSYSMRYAVHPTDGNHMGISPIRDFLVLLPVAMDPNPEAQFKFEELTKMSTKVTGTTHPGILSLIQLASAPAAPKLDTDEYNHIAFSAMIKNQSGTAMPISFVVKGHAEQ
jgi:hypothetical protein